MCLYMNRSRTSLIQWTWVWTNSGRQWRIGELGVLQSMGSQRNGHDWATEQQQQQGQPEKPPEKKAADLPFLPTAVAIFMGKFCLTYCLSLIIFQWPEIIVFNNHASFALIFYRGRSLDFLSPSLPEIALRFYPKWNRKLLKWLKLQNYRNQLCILKCTFWLLYWKFTGGSEFQSGYI